MSEHYLAVLKATYDYDPTSNDEIALKEDQLLFLIERVDDDWWKVKIKADNQEDNSPVGLVPAAYVEPASHTSVVKALYDYAANAPGELSISEDEILQVFDTEEEWILVQSTGADGMAGFVPATYVEAHTEEEEAAAPQIVVPPSPTRPVSTYVDPADRVASAKANADDIKTWPVSEVDKKGKKTKGTLGIGNGAVFFASESSKAAVQQWQSSTISNITIDKSKHVHFDVDGANAANLHFTAGSKDSADAIVAKLEASRSLASPSATTTASETATSPTTTRSLPPPLAAPPHPALESRRPSVHFSPAAPMIIPPRDDSTDDEDHEQESSASLEEAAVALYDFNADQDDEMTVKEGEKLTVLEKDDEWWKCRNAKGKEGVVPASYVELSGAGQAAQESDSDDEEERRATEAAAAAEEAEQEREREERAEAEALRKRKAEEEAKAKEKERKKKEASERAKAAAAAAAADEEAKKRKAAKAASPPPSPSVLPPSENLKAQESASSSSSGFNVENSRPPADRVRVWQDRTGQFRTEAAFLGYANGKLRLHKTNGVTVEVPAEKMSAEDLKYVEKAMSRKSKAPRVSDDDVPLAVQHRNSTGQSRSSNGKSSRPTQPPKQRVDWFEFFLSAGCDIDDCTRYAASFERDKIDASILGDITDSTMRSLGLREGDIIRVNKAISTRKPKADTSADAQIARDEALAKQLQAEESGRAAPKLFSNGPGDTLKSNPRRGRPTPNKSATVDLNAIGEIPRTDSPRAGSPAVASPVQPPPRASSALAISSGFDDDAWTVKSKPLSPAPPSATVRAPSAPPAAAPTPAPEPAPAPAPVVAPAPPASAPPAAASSATAPALAKTDADLFDQLARLSELRKTVPAPSPVPLMVSPMSVGPAPTPPAVVATPPAIGPGYQVGLGVGGSAPMGSFLQATPTGMPQQPYNGPRGPFAPVPSNQGLLQPLIPTQTGFGGFVPSRPSSTASPFQNPPPVPQQPSFLATQPTGYMGAQTSPFYTPAQGTPHPQQQSPFLNAQPTGYMPQTMGLPPQPLMSQPTGFAGMNGASGFQPNNSFAVQSHQTGFNPGMNAFNSLASAPPVPPLPANNNANTTNNTNPANIFAQMKSGTFAAEDSASQPSDRYDALRPNGVVPQATGWGGGYQGSFGYR